MPLEGVVNALRKIHAALVPGGLLVDTQPISPQPTVESEAGRLGALDMRDWLEVVHAVDRRVEATLNEGLWASRGEERFFVSDSFETGGELVETVEGWQGTRIPARLKRRLTESAGPARVHQQVRLRLLEAL